METEILSERAVARAADLLRAGQLVAFPTETVYGLGALISTEQAIRSIFAVKGRPSDNPLIAHIAHIDQWEMLACAAPASFFRLAEALFPGPLTLIVKRSPAVSPLVSAGLDTIAIRCPAHPLAQELIHKAGEPLVAPSANRSGFPSSTTAQHVLSDFRGSIPAVIDGGPCSLGLESTVVDLVSFATPTLLRPGALKREAIEEVLNAPLATYTKGAKSSPGMRYRHYSPATPVCLFADPKEFKRYVSKQANVFAIPGDQLDAKTLYALLRFADAERCDAIAIDYSGCEDPALINRLEKMSGNLGLQTRDKIVEKN